MVAHHDFRFELPDGRDTFIRLWPIPNRVAQTPHGLIVERSGVLEDGLKGGQIGMDIRENQNPHSQRASTECDASYHQKPGGRSTEALSLIAAQREGIIAVVYEKRPVGRRDFERDRDASSGRAVSPTLASR
jgi:hypothetical protein